MPSPSAPPSEEAAPTPTEAPTQEPPPVQADGFTAEVLVCRSISGSTCNEQLSTVPANIGSFTALVRFTDANAGDTMNAVLTGPAGTISGGPFTLGGGGNGYYYTNFPASNLPAGSYVVTAVRNGTEVAATSFVKDG